MTLVFYWMFFISVEHSKLKSAIFFKKKLNIKKDLSSSVPFFSKINKNQQLKKNIKTKMIPRFLQRLAILHLSTYPAPGCK